jgi:glucosamine kinase
MLTLGIDAGGSATRWVLLDAASDRVLGRGESGPSSGHIFDPAVHARSLAAFQAIAAAVRPMGVPERIAGGITGLSARMPEAATMAGWLADGLGIAAHAVTLGDDMWIAAATLFAPGAGGIVYAGTGSVGYAIDAAGRTVQVGGRGVVVDDAGAAWWIASRGLRAVGRAQDEDPDARTPLVDALAARLGSAAWPVVRAAVYATDRGGVAALAPFVADAARTGDGEAMAILEEAGRELARVGTVLARRVGCTALALAGGAFLLHPAIGLSLRRHLVPALSVSEPQIDAALAAARLAAQGRRAPEGL